MVLMIKKPTRTLDFGKYTLFPTDRSARKMLILIYIKFRTKKKVNTMDCSRRQKPGGFYLRLKIFPNRSSLSAATGRLAFYQDAFR
jgi:hypothetical protein